MCGADSTRSAPRGWPSTWFCARVSCRPQWWPVPGSPEVRFVLQHLGCPPIAAVTCRPGAVPSWSSLSCPTCAPRCRVSSPRLTREPGPSTTCVIRSSWRWTPFGPARLMLGSDWPRCLAAGSYSDVLDAVRYLLAELPTYQQDEIAGAVRDARLSAARRLARHLTSPVGADHRFWCFRAPRGLRFGHIRATAHKDPQRRIVLADLVSCADAAAREPAAAHGGVGSAPLRPQGPTRGERLEATRTRARYRSPCPRLVGGRRCRMAARWQRSRSAAQVVCGVNGGLPGMSVLNEETGIFEGMDADYCRAIAAAVLGDQCRPVRTAHRRPACHRHPGWRGRRHLPQHHRHPQPRCGLGRLRPDHLLRRPGHDGPGRRSASPHSRSSQAPASA